MTQEEYPIVNKCFEFDGKTYDCIRAIERDIKMIVQEAETSHKDSFDELYDKQSLMPNKVRLILDKDEKPVFGMIIYTIGYKNSLARRLACGCYYPFKTLGLTPHFYQGSICW